MKPAFRLLFACLPGLLSMTVAAAASAQTHEVHGRLADTAGKPVVGGAVSLLDPSDSTMEAFGVSDASGAFGIRAVKSGTYLLQVAAVGYGMLYKSVSVPIAKNDPCVLILRDDAHLLQEIEVKGVKIPVLLRGDTVEYNAGSFRTREDAAVEELLKKLPGVQVDNAGNVRAMGKDVQRVLVDGKEFFGDDPKMATKNLPADAIDKVQVFGNRSDAAKFTGIDDGVRNQTINLQMKKDRRNGYFGNVEAGGGTDARYQAAARLYRFRPEQQIAALGMLNNINKFGFSFQDYLSFQGGFQNIANGAGGLGFSGDMPVDFGQPVPGLITSGAAGLNYSADSKRGDRTTFSYLGNGAGKRLREERFSRNFSPAGTFVTREYSRDDTRNTAHRINAGWRTTGDSSTQVNLRGSARIAGNRGERSLETASGMDGKLRNSLSSLVSDNGRGYDLEGSASYIHKTSSAGWPVWELKASGSRSHTGASTDWNNTSSFLLDTTVVTDRQYQRNQADRISGEGGGSITRKLGRGKYLEPGLGVSYDENALYRSQGLNGTGLETDSLSARYTRRWAALVPALRFRINTKKTQFNTALEAEIGDLQAGREHGGTRNSRYVFLRPSLFYQYSWQQSTQLSVNYQTSVNQATAQQMVPVTNYLNPLQRIRGNTELRPEFIHTATASWMRFDQFSGTSLMANLRGIYTQDKISWRRRIRQDLSEDLQYVNVADDYNLDGGVEFATPLRKPGLEMSVGLGESFNRGLSFVNEVQNINTTFKHTGSLRLETTKLKYLDIEAGIRGDVTQARASIDPERRTTFYHYNAYSQMLWKPHPRFNIAVNGTLDHYTASGFNDAITIPLLNASASWYFLKFNRGVLTLDAFDLLNRNSAIQRVSQLNVLMEQRSNIIRRYVMLSFKYRLSKTASDASGVKVRVD